MRLLALLASASAFGGHADTVKARTALNDQPKGDATDGVRWKAAFLTQDRRVVDHLQDFASHSEAQGYGMFLAARFSDVQPYFPATLHLFSRIAPQTVGLTCQQKIVTDIATRHRSNSQNSNRGAHSHGIDGMGLDLIFWARFPQVADEVSGA